MQTRNENDQEYLPWDIQHYLLSFFDWKTKQTFSQTSKQNYEVMTNYGQLYYYAVGGPIELYNYYELPIVYMHPLSHHRVESVTTEKISDSLFNVDQVRIFTNLTDAESFAATGERHKKYADVSYLSDRPAIFVVSLSNPVNIKPDSCAVNNDIKPCFITPQSNVRIAPFARVKSDSKLYFFNAVNGTNKPKKYHKIWKSSIKEALDNIDPLKIKETLTRLFKSYFTSWSFVRHHSKTVNELINHISTQSTIQGLLQTVGQFHDEAKQNPSVSKKGTYWKMLTFSLDKLNEIHKIKKMPEIERYFNR